MLRTGLVLGLLALVGPAAIDMYLPAMPRIAEEFGTSETAVQMTLTGYFIAFGVAQLVYGPLADQAGRRLPGYTARCRSSECTSCGRCSSSQARSRSDSRTSRQSPCSR